MTTAADEPEGARTIGFVRMVRSDETLELMRDPLAFTLLALVACRAKWKSGFNNEGLELGEALIGDHKSAGMTRSEQRTRIAKLKAAGFLTTKTTNKGTVAKLTSSEVFDLTPFKQSGNNRHQNRQRIASQSPTDRQPIANGSPLTKKDNKGKKDKKDNKWRLPACAGPGFVQKWEHWVDVRMGMGKKPKDWNSMFQEQLDWLAQFTNAEAIEILSASIRNNWQGLFPPKNSTARAPSAPTRKGENKW